MALINCDSFDKYGDYLATVRGTMKWNRLAGNPVAGCRTDGMALGARCYGDIYVDPALSDWAFGFRFYWDGQAQSGICFGYIGGYIEPHRDWQLSVDVQGRLYAQEITLQSPGPTWSPAGTIFTCTRALVANAWNWIEVKSDSGTASVRVAKTTVGTGTLVSGAQVGFGFYAEAGLNLAVDDWYLISLDAETPDWFGDTAVLAYLMASDDSVEWTPLTGTDNFAMVDEDVADEDVTYNSTDAANKTDLFKLDPDVDLDASLDIFGAQLTVRAQKVTTASLDLVPLILSGTTESLGRQWGLPNGYGGFILPLASDPDTAAAWTVAGLIAASYGYRSLAPAG